MTDAEQRPVFEAVIEASTLEQFLETFYARGGMDSELIEEIVIEVGEGRVRSRATDPGSVALVESTLRESAFEHLTGDGVRFGVSIRKLLQFLDAADSDELVNLELDDETRKLQITFAETHVSAACIDPGAIRDHQDIPDLDLPNEFEVTGWDLKHAASLADMVSDHIELTTDTDADELVASASGDVDDVRHAVDVSGLSADVESMYSVDYIQALFQPISDDTIVTAELGDEFPILLHYEEADSALTTTSMLAPRIKSQ